MAFSSAYHDSDADDEYERSIMTSPILATDDETSPTDSDPPSTEPTPTTFGHGMDHFKQLSPANTIAAWTPSQCAEFISSLGMPREYCDKFLENEVDGEALIALRQEELKEIGIVSVGHRLTILSRVYDIKTKQGVPMDPDHYIPPSADAAAQDQTATRDDISRVIKSMEIRDHKILMLEANLNKVTEEYRKLREEVLPMIRMMKDRSQPLPLNPGSQSPDQPVDIDERSPYGQTPQFAEQTRGLSPAIPNPNHFPQPSPSPNQATIPSPTSPNQYINTMKYRDPQSQTSIYTSDRDRNNVNLPNNAPSRRPYQPVQAPDKDDPPPSAGPGREAPSVEIFKSFRVSMEDPCEKVLPAALKKYNIIADWKNYALYIVYGDQERCLGLKEKPLILFKQLDKEGRKPMFMLRRHAAPLEGHSGPTGGSIGLGTGAGSLGPGYDQLGTGRGHQSSIQLPHLPGGVL